MFERRATFVFAVLVAFSVVSAITAGPLVATTSDTDLAGPPDLDRDSPDPIQEPPDPDEDVIGWENGYWYNESIDVNQSDGLDDAELDAFVGRAMARVEQLRGLEFTRNVTIEPITRDELRTITNNTSFGASTGEQLWEAMFVVDEETNATDVIADYHTAVALGFAAEEGSDSIVIITDSPDPPVIGGVTLIHELAHMLQDQHFDLGQPKYSPTTLDAELGKDGLVEGEATYIHRLYQHRCADEWECVETPAGWSFTGLSPSFAIAELFSFPYLDGPTYVDQLVEDGGWEAVDTAHETVPHSSEQIVHPGSDDEPEPLQFRDTARNGWTPQEPLETVGEVGLYVMFANQATTNDISALDEQLRPGPGGPADASNYQSVPSVGWANDRLVPYESDDEHGYVWTTAWESEQDAREFYDAYLLVLQAEGATQVGENVWVIEDGGFADAFRVSHDGTTVDIVNGPTITALDDIRPSSENGTTCSVR